MNYKIEALTLDNNMLTSHPVKQIEEIHKEIAFVFHVFYADIWHAELKPYMDKIKLPYDLYMTIPESISDEESIKILKSHPQIHLYKTENRGRDVLPFLQILNLIGTDRYKYICKIHTKKSADRDLGTVWRKLLYYDLIGSNKIVVENLELFEYDSDIAMLTGKNTVLDSQKYDLGNREKTDNLIQQCQLEVDAQYTFAGGTMFWVRPHILEPLLQLFRDNKLHFELETGQMDNTLAHAIERFFGILCHASDKKIVASTSEYRLLTEEILQSVANLVLSQTYAGEDMFLKVNKELQAAHIGMRRRDDDIKKAHKGMQKRDEEIIKLHKALRKNTHLLELKNQQISILTHLTLKTRIKQQLKKIIPNKILIRFGFSAYSPIVLPTESIE